MPYRLLLTTVFSLLACVCSSQLARAEAPPQIYLLTIGPGDGLAERFGHTALHLSFGGKDLVVSFGAAPFEDPAYLFEYVRGKASVQVVATDYQTLLARSRASNRQVESQRLNLSLEQAQALMRELWASLKPPRNQFVYDQLFDNCSTRVRDLLDAVSRGALKRAAQTRSPERTFRTYTLEASSGHFIAHWGFDLVVGPNQDRPVDGWQELYLPVYLRDAVARARITHLGVEVPLADSAVTIAKRHGENAQSGHEGLARTTLVMLGVFTLLSVAAATFRRDARAVRKLALLVMSIDALVFGVFGLLVWFLVLVSAMPDLRWNENVLLFWPTDFAVVIFALRAMRENGALPTWLSRYQHAHALSLAAFWVLKLTGLFAQDNVAFAAFCTCVVGASYVAVRNLGQERSSAHAGTEAKLAT